MPADDRKRKRARKPAATRKVRVPAPAAAGPEPASYEGDAFPIVGIGASAGGLEAFTRLLKHVPTDTGLGFVLVQHLDPQHDSALTQILARATRMPVHEVRDNLRVQPNHVYIIPPNAILSIAQGVLKLRPRGRARTPSRSIDGFFESLAHDQHERAIGVILSGTATDGTVGLEDIKAEGGITFAQDGSAKYDSMPRSAVAAGCVDFVLSPENIAAELTRIAKHPYVAGRLAEAEPPQDGTGAKGRSTVRGRAAAAVAVHADDATPLPSGDRGVVHLGAERSRAEAEVKAGRRGPAGDGGFKQIMLLLRNHSGVDFSLYKSTTIQRRIGRRMVLNKLASARDYTRFLKGNAKELDALYSDVLISVTSFFRNPEAFDVLKRVVFPAILKRRGDDPVRVWTLGCSTGQEAYSIAMAFLEVAEHAPRARKLQVFATDLNDALLEKARHGLYARSLVHDVSPERLRRFFIEEEGGYRVTKSLREMVVFARQNLVGDPPFSRMDLISCRNLLIYLEPALQKKALPTFHYALRPGGFLLLGASESIVGFSDLFEPADKKYKVFARKVAPTPGFHLPLKKKEGFAMDSGAEREARTDHHVHAGRATVRPYLEGDGLRADLSAQREADRLLVNQFAPPGVLIDAESQILQFRGSTGAYLQPPTGKASFDVLKMAREGLMLPLRAAINQAKKENRSARRENVRLKRNGASRMVNVEVIPLKNLAERCLLVLFEDAAPAGGRVAAASGSRKAARGTGARRRQRAQAAPDVHAQDSAGRIGELENELAETRDYLQAIQEQYEAANEELQAANEEAQSANEELQSVNEELETSKEELESSNEELTTINEEMNTRNVELSRLNSDLSNLQTSTRLAIMLLGRDLTIRRFSAQAEKQFNLLATDLGRPVSNIRHDLQLDPGPRPTGGGSAPASLEDFIAEVIESVREQEREVCDRDGRWYSLRVRPYMTLDNKVDGAVLVLVDINDLKRSQRDLQAAGDYAEAILRTARDPLIVLRADLHVNTANDAYYRMFRTAPQQTEDTLLFDLCGGAWAIPRLRALLEGTLHENKVFNDFEITQDFGQLGRRALVLNGRRLQLGEGAEPMILLAIEDATERKRIEAALRRSYTELQSHAQEVDRFNHAAVGRELRMIDLKKEINELCRRHGEPERYALEFEQNEPHAGE